jgi:NAD(P)-dependent dehydrogenase (short-subunit alcohol dehydrogenase family)
MGACSIHVFHPRSIIECVLRGNHAADIPAMVLLRGWRGARLAAVAGSAGIFATALRKSHSDAEQSSANLVVVVTGCTSGLGRGLAREFRDMGHTVIGCARREDRLSSLREEFGPPHQFHVCDVTDEASVAAFASNVGRCDVVIANAGTVSPGSVPWEMDGKDFRRVMDVNVNGVFHVTRHFLPKLVEQCKQDGAELKRLINISSGTGHSSNPDQAAYCASKWAVEALSKSTAQAMIRAGLGEKIICVPLAPGTITTEMNTKSGHPVESWAPTAARYILSLGPAESGASLALTQFYDPNYLNTWVIPPGLRVPPFRRT